MNPEASGSNAGSGSSGRAAAAALGFLGLGSNLGDRRAHLQSAVDRLGALGVTVEASSRLYASEPVGLVLDQPEFLNACVRIRTTLDGEQLLVLCKGVEVELGRTTTVRHGPRVIDIDILTLGATPIDTPRLTIPHRELARRRFVLVALAELVGDGELAGVGRPAELLQSLQEPGEVSVFGPPLAV